MSRRGAWTECHVELKLDWEVDVFAFPDDV